MKLPQYFSLNKSIAFPLLTLIVCLLITYQAFNIAMIEVAQKTQTYFDFSVREATNLINQRMQAYEQVLRGTAGLFKASNSVERNEFKQYVATLNLVKYYPGVQGLGLSLVVPSAKKTQHIASIRSEGFPEYTIRPEGQRDIYTSIIYLEPFFDRNLRAFGYDMFTEPVRHAAMQKAIDSGQVTLSGKVKLIQETDKQAQAGFLMYLPIYRNGTNNDTPSERREHIIGWVYVPFRMNDLMDGLFGEHASDLDIDIFDGENISSKALMYDPDSSYLATAKLGKTLQVQMADHAWTIRISPLPLMNSRFDANHPALVAAIGTMLSILLSLIIWLLLTGRERAIIAAIRMNNDLITERQRLSSIIEGTNIGTWEWNVQTGETSFNEHWANIIGYELSELEPTSIETWMKFAHPDDVKLSGALLEKHFSGELAYYECEARMQHKYGHWVWVLDRGKVATWTPDGKPLLMSGTHQAITERKQSEIVLNELNLELKKSEQSLRVSEERLKLATHAGGVAIWDLDLVNNVLIWDDSMFALYGAKQEDFSGAYDAWQALVHPEDRFRSDKELQDAIQNINPFNTEFRAILPSGNIRDIKATGEVFRDTHGNAVRIVGVNLDITERKQAQATLLASEFRWKFAVEGSGDGVWDWNVQTDEKIFSSRWKEILGYAELDDPKSFTEWENCFYPEDKSRAEKAMQDYLDGITPTYNFEGCMQCKDGNYKWVASRGIAVSRDDAGKTLRIIGTLRDITERKLAELNLQKESEKNIALLHNASDGIHILDYDGNVVEASDSFCNMLGYSRDQVIGMNVSSWDAAFVNLDELLMLVRKQFEKPVRSQFERRHRCKDGSIFDVEISGYPLVLEGKKVLFNSSRNITSRKQVESQLLLHSNILENVAEGVFLIRSADSTIVFTNPQFDQMFGYLEGELVGQNVSIVNAVTDKSPKEISETINNALRMNGEWHGEVHSKRKDGSTFWSGVSVSTLYNSVHGEVWVALHSDITERKLTEKSLRIAAAAFEAQEALMVADAKQTILQVNKAFTNLTGYSEEDSVGRPVTILKSGMHNEIFYRAMWDSIRGEGYWEGEIWDRRRNGEVFLARTFISAVENAEGIVTHYVASFVDITLIKQAEDALLEARAAAEQASKDKSRFLAAASHDLRQPLTALSLYVEVLTRQSPLDDNGLGNKIQNCVNSLSELLNDLLDVSKLDAGVVTPNLSDVPVNDLLQSMITIHTPEAEQKGLRLRVRHSAEMVNIDQQLMHRVVGNLVFNAIRYTNKGGILIGYRRHHGKQWIEVWDTGIGIADKDLDHIFAEFTQLGDGARNRGSGLGLAIVDKTAKLLGLQVRIRSRLGKGSMFAIEMPLGHVIPTEMLAVIEPLPARLTIAFVDDNLGILEAFSLAMNAFGHEVISATGGRELFNLLGSRKPDILVTDYRLADGETGLELIMMARRLLTDNLPAILITGDTDPELLQVMAKQNVMVFHKPIKMSALDKTVREVVARNVSAITGQFK